MPDEYQIGSGFSDQELNAASWFVRHRVEMRRLRLFALILLNLVLWGYVGWSLLDAYVISYPRESHITVQIDRDQLAVASMQASAPQSLQPSDVAVFANTDNRQDFLVQLSNPNPQWWAEFTYHFQTGGDSTPAQQGYILPGGTRYLTQIGWKGATGSPALQIDSLTWHRVNPQDVELNYQDFANKRLQFDVENPTYDNNLTIGTQQIGQTNFILHNDTGYGYWDVDLTIVLYKLGTPVAVTTLTETQIHPDESRPISINWFDNQVGIDKTEVQANVNILDPSVYLPTDRF